MLRTRCGGQEKSNVTQMASYPESLAQRSQSLVTSRSLNGYNWSQRWPAAALANSSNGTFELALTAKIVPQAAAARYVALSPSGWALLCPPHGAIRTGRFTLVPTTVVERSRLLTFRSTRGRSAQDSKPRRVRAHADSTRLP